jgi:ATP-dependent RNA helicase DDX10/DBP4
MGFRQQMIRILDYLPPGKRDGGTRQTLLFSATQTKRVADLAALSLHKPEYIGVHDKVTTGPTPESLQQSMVVVPLENKLDTIFSFIKSHLKKKSIIFLNSCSQIRHVYELFCALQPGVPLLALHGKLKQEKRTKVYFDFLQRPHAVLFATDVAARGLDFPNVDWVVQADAPEDKEMYIHRVGRTARYNAGGKSLLVLIPSELSGMSQLLQDSKIPVKKLSINPTKTVVVSQKACGIVASKPELNGLAKKAYKSYIRSVFLMPNKEIFQVDKLPLDEFATSLGLAVKPSLRFLKALKSKDRDEIRSAKNVNYKLHKLKQQIKAEKLKKKLEKLGKSPEDIMNDNEAKKRKRDDDDDDNGNVLIVKKRHNWKDDDDDESALPIVDINKVTRSRSDKRIYIDGSSNGANKRIVFKGDSDEENEEIDLTKNSNFGGETTKSHELADANADYLRLVRERLNKTKDLDRSEEKDRVREKHKKQKLKEKALNMDDDDEYENEEMVVTLATSDASEVDDNDSGSSDNSSDESSDDDESDDENKDVKAQEDLALALIHGKR